MEIALRGADAIRRAFWRVTSRTSFGRLCVRDRMTRVTTAACLHMAVLCALVTVMPLWVLLLGPIFLGVPHVLADLRYLVLAPEAKMPRRVMLAIGLPLLAMTVLRAIAVLGGPLTLQGEAIAGAAAILGAMFLADARPRTRLIGLAVGALVAGLAIAFPYQSALGLGHAHNFVALGLWMWWCKGDGAWRHVLVVGATFAGASTLILSGALDPVAHAFGAYEGAALGLELEPLVETLAPGIDGAFATRLVVLYAFAQAVHYSLWLRLIPNTRQFQPRQTPPSLSRSFSLLARDLGKVGVLVGLCATFFVIALGAWRPAETREIYLSLVLFHGWLELAAIAHLAVRRAAPQSAPLPSGPSN